MDSIEQRAREAFEAHFDASADDPFLEGELELWLAAWRAALSQAQPAAGAVPEGLVLVPVEPPTGLLVSMAIRADHALGCAGYYDAPVFGAEGGGHMRRLEAAVSRARQMFDEVVGAGFYTPEREAHYAAMLAVAPHPQAGNGNG